jgi:hypothetical protein
VKKNGLGILKAKKETGPNSKLLTVKLLRGTKKGAWFDFLKTLAAKHTNIMKVKIGVLI